MKYVFVEGVMSADTTGHAHECPRDLPSHKKHYDFRSLSFLSAIICIVLMSLDIPTGFI